MELSITREPERWEAWLDDLGFDDPYYEASYGRIWEAEESAEWIGLYFDADESGEVVYPVLRDPLAYLDAADRHCDIRTAYDFGGPVALGDEPEQALSAFRSGLEELAEEWSIVTEFARLHPYRVRPLPNEATYHADNLHVDLRAGLQTVRQEYDARHRERIEQATEAGVSIELFHGEAAEGYSDVFLELYYRTMLRVGAGRHYYFLPETLRSLIRHPQMTLAVATSGRSGKAIGAGLFFRAGEVLFYYLSGSHPGYLKSRPNNLMLDRIVEYGCDREFDRLHLGGGSESLRDFKSQIANGSVDYHILKKVYDEQAYRRLAESTGADPESDGAFPAYWPLKYEGRERPPLF